MIESNFTQDISALKKLPNSWSVIDFGEVFTDISGGNKKFLKSDFLVEGKVAVVDQGKDLIAGYTNEEDEVVKGKPPYIVFGDHTRIFKFIDFPFVMGADGTKVFKVKDITINDEKYLFHFLNSLNIPNTGYNRHFKYLKSTKIPLPPLTQQQKIANILDAADALRQNDKALIAKYDELTQALFLDMFGDPVSNPKVWEIKRLKNLISKLNTGVSVNSDDTSISNGKNFILKTSCVYSGIFNPKEVKVIRDDEFHRAKLNPKKDSIIISRMNTSELVGKSAYIPQDSPNIYLPDRLWQTEKNDLEHSALWLSYNIGHKSYMNEISKISSGTSGSMKNISKASFLELKTIYPPLELQNQFVERVAVIEEQKAIAQKSLEKSESLFNSLLQKAFKGELL